MAKRWIGSLLVLCVLFVLWQVLVRSQLPPQDSAGLRPEAAAPGPPAESPALEHPVLPATGPDRESIPSAADAAPAGGAEEDPKPVAAVSAGRDDFNARLMRLGEGVPGASVRLTRSGETVEQWVTDSEGRFAIPRSSRRGMRRLEIDWGGLTLRVSPARMRFREGEEAIYRIGTGTVTVRVWAKGGVPLPDAIVALQVRAMSDRANYSQRKTSGQDGTAVFHGVPAGPLTVDGACGAPNRANAQVKVEGDSVTIDLGPAPDAATLAVQVKLADGSASSTRYGMHAQGLGSLADKSYSVDCSFLPSGLYETDIPPGRYRITSDPKLPGTPRDVEVVAWMDPIELVAEGAIVRGMLLGREPSWPDADTGLGSEYGDSPREAWLLEETTGKRLYLARIRDSGRFEITGVAPGRYVLTGNKSRIDPELSRVPVQVNNSLDVLDVELEVIE